MSSPAFNSSTQTNVSNKKQVECTYSSSNDTSHFSRKKNNHYNYNHHEGNSRKHFSWINLFKFTYLVHILNLRCSFHVQYPDKSQVSHIILLIPRLCKQTVKYTIHQISRPRRTPLTSDTQWDSNTNIQDIMYNLRRHNGSRGSKRAKLMKVARYLRLPLSQLLSLIFCPALFAYRRVHSYRRNRSQHQPNSKSKLLRKTVAWQVKCYRMMPLKSLSNAWGFINSLHLPVFLRPIILTLYVKTFQCDLSEAEVEDLKYYENLGEFFRRSLKRGARPIDSFTPLVRQCFDLHNGENGEYACIPVSPADGTVLHFGKVDCGVIEQIKGVTYSISQFLGPPTWNETIGTLSDPTDCEEFTSKILHHQEGTSLFHCVIYLAPGDYHRFHSPVEWNANFRRHFAGELLSVNPKIVKFISGLFSLNERAVYTGVWKHGFFSFTAVGATTVGSIRVYDDPELQTNVRYQPKGELKDKVFEKPLYLSKGENFGEFNLGSTIVLIFEAPSDFRFALDPGMHVKVGETLISKCC